MVEIDNEKAASWLSGAQPTEAVEKLLNISGAMNTMKVRTGQIHTVGAKPAAEPAEAPAPAEEPVAGEIPPTRPARRSDLGQGEIVERVVTYVVKSIVEEPTRCR